MTKEEILAEINKNNLAAEIKTAIIAQESGVRSQESGVSYKISSIEYGHFPNVASQWDNRFVKIYTVDKDFTVILYQNNSKNLNYNVWGYTGKKDVRLQNKRGINSHVDYWYYGVFIPLISTK